MTPMRGRRPRSRRVSLNPARDSVRSRCVDASARPSCSKRRSLIANPPPKPVRAPSAPTTRCQGTTIPSGLEPTACPTARAAFGLPMA